MAVSILLRLPWEIWQRLPVSVKRFVRSNQDLDRLKGRASEAFKAGAGHDHIYTEFYYEGVDDTLSAPIMAEILVRDLSPATAMDVGCGTGTLLQALRSCGVPGLGLEVSAAGIERCRQRGLEVRPFDLERDELPSLERRDLVACMEVAEHLPASCADRLVDLLCRAGRNVAFAAAPPGQGGTDHVNEQPNQYWVRKFEDRGFRYDEPLSMRWRAIWKERGVASWYSDNIMVFRDPRQGPEARGEGVL